MIEECSKCCKAAKHTDEDWIETGISRILNPRQPEKYYFCKKCRLMNVYCQSCGTQHVTPVFSHIGRDWRHYICNTCNKKRNDDVKINAEKYFEEHKKTSKYWKNTNILSDKEFNDIFEHLKKKDSAVWCKCIIGLEKAAFALMFTSDQAVQLLDHVYKNNMPCEKWRYDNIIGTSVINPCDGRLWRYDIYCRYYSTRRANTKEKLFDFWDDFGYKTFNCKPFAICECSVCLENVMTPLNREIYECDHCNNTFHRTCIVTCVKNDIRNCPLCRSTVSSNQ